MGILERIRSSADVKALSMEEIGKLCSEIRAFLINNISRTGGHLASNLGVVELTVALHNVFDSEKDRIVFDVGHQCYVHKLLTGRAAAFSTLRQKDGLAGFPKPSESDSDAFIAGHASNPVSAALGMARARTLSGKDHSVIAVIGDGAMTGGLAYEGLDNAGQSGEPLIVVLNDNGMAIGANVGGMASSLALQRTRPAYYRLKKTYRKIMYALPGGKHIFSFTQKLKNSLKNAIFHCSMFEEMGFRYIGPVDGHDVKKLSYMLKIARDYNQPVLLHVVTQKGRGYEDAEKHPEKYHGVGSFDPDRGIDDGPRTSFSEVFGQALCEEAAKDERICAVTAAMEDGTGLGQFRKSFPDRFFDEGIAEGHCVTMSAGMAKQGLIPVFSVYSTFLQRAYDMLIHDVAILAVHVVLAVDRAGLVGGDGETHNGVFDVGFLRQTPGMTVFCPSNYAELRSMLRRALACAGPAAVRYPRGCEGEYREEGKNLLRKGDDITIVSYGIMINEALKAADILEKNGISAEVVKLDVIAPLDLTQVRASVEKTGRAAVMEDCCEVGSVGEALKAELSCPVMLFNTGRGFTPQATVDQQRQLCGIDALTAAERIIEERKT
ncbi:MAG: 1-deoxy-D-xylulose-5-phosphate synthase [Oscillospiraceae bacterium]|nr:1-deoxy-D-xylulose-5-phosphate synthase [Oscillospiraceae bacterium]